ncbi:ATP-binding protein [Hydrogenophaga sp. 5NK40-0174]|uniref:sensor histidine kinase n=1 Tax=Hydrogenophaga sp. 5NK40-0174 TaxID=3127649 RepID=UPI003107A677
MTAPKVRSIRSRLLRWQFGALLVTAAIAAGVAYFAAWKGFNRVRDHGLEEIAQSVARHGTIEAPRLDNENRPDLGEFVSQVWRLDGQLSYSSLADIGPPLQTPGIHHVIWRNEEWRVFTLREKQELVQVAMAEGKRREDFVELLPSLFLPIGIVLVLALMLRSAVVNALVPLNDMRAEIAAREVNDLMPLRTDRLPDEVAPVGQAFNELMRKVERTLTSQRQFVADAAHELNTPLAAIKLHAQLARRARDEADRLDALVQLEHGIDRVSHLARQLLLLARLEPDMAAPDMEPVALARLAGQCVAQFSAQAEQQGVDLGLQVQADYSVLADPHGLQVLIDNLIGNALRYAPRGSRIDVLMRRDEEGPPELCVIDEGPGISPADRPRVLQRFARLEPEDSSGSGLGLAIVDSIVKQIGGALSLEDTPGGGLTVRIRFAGDQTASKP